MLRLVPGFSDLDALVGSEIRGVVLMLYGQSQRTEFRSCLFCFVEPLHDYRTRCVQRSHGITSAITHHAPRPAACDTAPSLACTGNAPAKKSAFVSWVKRMVGSGKMVVRALLLLVQSCRTLHWHYLSHVGLDQVACSQCLRGRVVLEAYSVGKALHDAGVVRRAG